MIVFTYNPIILADYKSRRRHFLTKCLLPGPSFFQFVPFYLVPVSVTKQWISFPFRRMVRSTVSPTWQTRR